MQTFRKLFIVLMILFNTKLFADLPPVPNDTKLNPSNTTEIKTLEKVELKNQFDEAVSVNEKTKWLIFSTDKNLSDIINKQIEAQKLTDLSKYEAVYAADISKMPSLVTKMFALPKMKKYPFKMALDFDGQTSKNWPQKEGHVSFIKLESLKITETQYLKTEEEIKSALSKINSP